MSTVMGVFHTQQEAQQAISELTSIGFNDEQIGVLSKFDKAMLDDEQSMNLVPVGGHESHDSASHTAATGIAIGLGAGTLWGIGIAAGLIPAIGPVIAGGTLATILASAATAAAAGGIAGALAGHGFSEDMAKYYEGEFSKGRILVIVKTDRVSETQTILRKFGAYEMNSDPLEIKAS
jgi:hypothetical protein